MKQSVINVVVGFLFFTVMFLLYNLLFQDDMGGEGNPPYIILDFPWK